jgi:hypothetical protein
MVIVREWRHVKMLKRAGRGHDTTGITGTKPGELIIRCRACPHPEINLPTCWQDTPATDRWLYSLLVAEDANFKQKAQFHSNDVKDPALGPGWATFVDGQIYEQHILEHGNQDEVRDRSWILLVTNYCHRSAIASGLLPCPVPTPRIPRA